jgi:hypothetical protein
MSIIMQKLSQKEFLLFSLVSIVVIFLLAGFFHEDDYPLIEDQFYYTDIFFVTVPIIAVAFSIILVIRHGLTGNNAKAWILYCAATILWFAADQTYYHFGEYAAENNNSYLVDSFYFVSYFLYFGFMIFYLIPRKNKITKKNILLSATISTSFIMPAFYFFIQSAPSGNFETIVNFVYPFLDALVFVPAFISVILFFRGQVNFLWITITLSLICMAAADTIFLVERYYGVFSASSAANLFFAWRWIFLIFGSYSHIQIFGATKKSVAG